MNRCRGMVFVKVHIGSKYEDSYYPRDLIYEGKGYPFDLFYNIETEDETRNFI